LSQLHELGVLDGHEAWRNKMTFESFFELVPNDLNISGKGGSMMIPLDAYNGSSASLKIGGFISMKSLKLLY
jgi:hypothetical protein